MTERIVKLYGPPGTGKTTVLNAQAQKSIDEYGPDRVAALTFTRAAADELKTRIMAGRGVSLPTEQYRRRKILEQQLPFVGTIHSLALKMAGGHVLSAENLRDFITSQGGVSNGLSDELDSYVWAEPGKDEVAAALAVWAAARHRLIPLEAAYAAMPWGYQGPPVTLERAAGIVAAYEDHKQQMDRIDFEDMLERGLTVAPPVDVVLADEVQDNSPLLWKVVDHWSRGRLCALAGDPWQAIYLFSGAQPELFVDHPGTLRSLGNSRRLTERAAGFAQHLLFAAGYSDEGWLETWTGVGTGDETDGSTFYLARTGRLLVPIYRDLEVRGVPYGYVRGGGPLETRAADGFRTLIQLRDKGAAEAWAVHKLAEACGPHRLPFGEKARLKALATHAPQELISAEEIMRRWASGLDGELLGIKNAAYFRKVHALHGVAAFLHPPKTRVGTIHAAKGREADTVHLVTSWATLPYRSLNETREGRRAEACVAYVAATRHRSRLIREHSNEGSPYPDL